MVTSLSVNFGAYKALDMVDLHIHCGELTAIIGPNGGGKSTLLKSLLGELRYSGEVRYRPSGGDVAQPVIGYVPQKVTVARDTPMSVMDFLLLTLQRFPVWLSARKSAVASAKKSLELVSALHLEKRTIGELSGGELQRVLLARAMNPVPDILLLDEPVSGVDVKGLAQFYETICDLRRRYDISIILVTHDIAAIAPHADRMILLDKKIIFDGTPSQMLAHNEFLSRMGSRILPISRIPADTEIHGGTS